MGLHDPFGHLTHKLWPKEGSKVKLAIWLPPTKSHDFVMCRWRATYHWKPLDNDYNFSLDLISIRGLKTKLWAHKVVEVPTLGILGLPLGSPRTKCHLGVGLVARHKVYSKGEGGDFPHKSKPWWILWVWICPWFILTPKAFQLCTNQLIVWFVQVHVNK
jgi:hypothetical protein